MSNENDFTNDLRWAIAETSGSTAYDMARNRPYDGQPHTDSGKRGETAVEGLTMRDVADCIVRGFLAAGGSERENPIWDDVYTITGDLDYIAVVQNTMCWVERYMGIYPNVPELKHLDPSDHEDD